MKTIRINNLIKSNGEFDYKGLDIDLFINGSQIYFDEDMANAYCYVKTMEDNIPKHDDIKEASEEYEEAKKIKESKRKQQGQSIEERLSAIEIGLANTLGM